MSHYFVQEVYGKRFSGVDPVGLNYLYSGPLNKEHQMF